MAFSLLGIYLICDAIPQFAQLALGFTLMEGKQNSLGRDVFMKAHVGDSSESLESCLWMGLEKSSDLTDA